MSILQELSRLRLYAIGTPDERRAVLRVRRLGIHNGKVLHARKGRPDQPAPVAADKPAPTCKQSQPAGDDAAIEAISDSGCQDWEARAILDRIRRGEVPGIWATRLDPEKVRNAHMEEIADLRAKLAEADSAATEWLTQRNQLAERVAELEAQAGKNYPWRQEVSDCMALLDASGHDPQGGLEVMIRRRIDYTKTVEAERDRALADLAAAKEDAERAKMERNGMHVKNYAEWQKAIAELHLARMDLGRESELRYASRDRADKAESERDTARAEADALRDENTTVQADNLRLDEALKAARAERDALRARRVTLPEPYSGPENYTAYYRAIDVWKMLSAAGVGVD